MLHHVRPFVCVADGASDAFFSPACVLHHRLTDWCCQHDACYQTHRDQACQPSPLPPLTSHIVTSSLGDTDFTEGRWPLCLTSWWKDQNQKRLPEGEESKVRILFDEYVDGDEMTWWFGWISRNRRDSVVISLYGCTQTAGSGAQFGFYCSSNLAPNAALCVQKSLGTWGAEMWVHIILSCCAVEAFSYWSKCWVGEGWREGERTYCSSGSLHHFSAEECVDAELELGVVGSWRRWLFIQIFRPISAAVKYSVCLRFPPARTGLCHFENIGLESGLEARVKVA